MIAYLVGKPVVLKDRLIVLVNGVGYGVLVGTKVIQTIGVREQIELFIYTHVREDQLDLYGFINQKQLDLFKLLMSVSGVGPKTALAIVDAGENRLIESVQQAETSFFTAIPRVGKKLAQKIIIELKSKLGEIRELNLKPLSSKEQEAYDALLGLGFNESDISKALQNCQIEELSIEQTISFALKNIGKK
ncbi:MAG: Holliday junction branch migration protein RuvA [Patescibacteria group bacterium]